jgi:hypothetical protein
LRSEDKPDGGQQALALSYLRQLKASGYFPKAHTFCDGAWFAQHPAGKDNDTWRDVERMTLTSATASLAIIISPKGLL